MPSVTDLQQQQQTSSSNTHGKSTPPPSSSSTQQLTSADPNNSDPLTQAILLFEKKQRNLGKRKEKLESYKQLAATGAELNKDQKEALAKYPEVLGQIECAKDLGEQFKKIQTETAKYQKRLLKQAADEKRQSVAQRLREYAQIRYLLDHRPTSLKTEESTLLDELSAVIVPTDNTSNSISRSVDTVLSIYQSGPSSTTIKNLPGKNVQEVREILEQLVRNVEPQKVSSVVIPPEQEQTQTQIQTPAPTPAPTPTPIQETIETNNIQSTNNDNNNNNININNNTSLNEYPLQFDTRNPNISLEQIIQDNTFLSNDLHDQSQDTNDNQLSNSEQYLQTFTIVNSNQQPSSSSIENQQQDNSNEQHQQQSDEQWQHQRGNGNVQRNEHGHNEGGHKPYRGRPNHYNQSWRGSNGGRYDNSYGNNQRPYYENNRGRGGSNSNYRGNRGGGGGGGGNHRFGNNRGYNNNNGNGYQNSAQYQHNNNNQQQQQTRSAPPPSTQQQ